MPTSAYEYHPDLTMILLDRDFHTLSTDSWMCLNTVFNFVGLWAVVNNATWAAFGEFEWLPAEVYRRSIDVNLLSAIRITQLFLPSIRKARGEFLLNDKSTFRCRASLSYTEVLFGNTNTV